MVRNSIIFLFFFLFGQLAFSQTFNFLPTSEGGQIIKREQYTLSYKSEHKQAEWVAYELTRKELEGTYSRSDDFRPDPAVKTGSASLDDYKGCGYDRGHLIPAGDCSYSASVMSESFYLSNMSPQDPSFNRGIWRQLEDQVRMWAAEYGAIYVVTAGVLGKTQGWVGENKVTIPQYFYKVVMDPVSRENKMIALLLPNKKGESTLQTYVVPVDSIELLTGIDFFPALPDNLEEKLEAAANPGVWSWFGVADVSAGSTNQPADVSSCLGITKSTGARCLRTAVNVRGYCYQHEEQDPKQAVKTGKSVQCAGTTKSGKRCRKKTDNTNGRCNQH